MPTQPIIWVHADCLSPHSPALSAYPNAPALFVWDEELLANYQLSLKRIVFIYECLLELPVTIRRGEVATELLVFASEHAADAVITVASPSPRFQAISDRLAHQLPVTALPLEPFAVAKGNPDLKRFSRYWRAVEASAMRKP
ncbi:MAG: hypothetical protein AB4911_13685 [Oscillochloridaceae bacterium umkhey_bin13]